MEFIIKDLSVNVLDKEILKDFNLSINSGEIHAIMGPNGTGKSTLSKVIMGHPSYNVSSGDIIVDVLSHEIGPVTDALLFCGHIFWMFFFHKHSFCVVNCSFAEQRLPWRGAVTAKP